MKKSDHFLDLTPLFLALDGRDLLVFPGNIRYAESSIPDATPSKLRRVILSFQLKQEATGFSFQGKQNHNQTKSEES
jgi:hypothetical protein